jgi:hypothetical protein
MKAASSVLRFFYHLKMALYFAKDTCKMNPKSIYSHLFEKFITKIEWIYNTTITYQELHNKVPDSIVIIKEKWDSQIFDEMAINEKITLLDSEQIIKLEEVVDMLLNGDLIMIETK